MKAAVFDEFGPVSVMQIRDMPRPEITSDQILVELHATSINPIDWKIREGMMKMRFGEELPQILGFDAAGTVVEVGDQVNKFQVGDQIYGRSVDGTGKCYAEYVALDPGMVARKPQGLSYLEAGAMPLAALTALIGLRDCGELQEGQRVLIIGASGGVGTYAVQIAKCMGAHVTGVCSARNLDLARELGADEVIDYTCEDVLAADEPYDVVYDTVGSQQVDSAREVLTENGVYMTLVPVPGIEFFIPGQTERVARSGYFVAWTPSAADLEILSEWVEAGRLTTVIDSQFDLDQIHAAHERSETLHARGKIVVSIKE